MILATKNDALWTDVSFTPAIEGGVGPVAIGDRLVLKDEAGVLWYIAVHPFGEVDGAWLAAYTSGDNPAIVILPEIPATWTHPAAGA
jgi:hypothetical protein